MNRTTLLIPALCGQLDGTAITQALSHASQNDLEQWEAVIYPILCERNATSFFIKMISKKWEKITQDREGFRQPSIVPFLSAHLINGFIDAFYNGITLLLSPNLEEIYY
jgi:hypothetical protein